MLEMRLATAADIDRMGKRLPRTSRTFAFTSGEEVVGIAGYFLDEGKAVLFALINHEVARAGSRWYARDVLKFARALIQDSMKAGIPIAASADPEYPGSDVLLEHMGMRNLYKDIYVWHGTR